MALGPHSINENKQVLAEYMERSIDEIIERSHRVPIYIAVDAINKWDLDAFYSHIVPRYLEAGWSRVEYTSDQREGNFITLA